MLLEDFPGDLRNPCCQVLRELCRCVYPGELAGLEVANTPCRTLVSLNGSLDNVCEVVDPRVFETSRLSEVSGYWFVGIDKLKDKLLLKDRLGGRHLRYGLAALQNRTLI